MPILNSFLLLIFIRLESIFQLSEFKTLQIMYKFLSILTVFLLSGFSVLAQDLPKMNQVTGGTSTLGGGYQYRIDNYSMIYIGVDRDFEKLNQNGTAIGEVPKSNNAISQVNVADFMLAESEVTNAQYKAFVLAKTLEPNERIIFEKKLKATYKGKENVNALWKPVFAKAAALGILPDTACWVTDFVFAYNEPLTKHYLWHPAFDQYPVVGVSWIQAKAYCTWLTEISNEARRAKNLPELPAFRLPTENEWEFAARATSAIQEEMHVQPMYPWAGIEMIDEKGHYRANIKTGNRNYIGDGYEYTSPVKSFSANDFGLFDMAGNVSEWCDDAFQVNLFVEQEDINPSENARDQIQLFTNEPKSSSQKVVKGGSWAEYAYAAQCGSRMGFDQAKGSSRIGFRVAMSID